MARWRLRPDLPVMKRALGRRASRRSVPDATWGPARPQLTHKLARRQGRLVVADRRPASSKLH